MTLQEWLEQNEKVCQEATLGPWIDGPQRSNYGHRVTANDGLTTIASTPQIEDERDHDENSANAEFIAASRLSLPTALKIIRAWSTMIHGDTVIVAIAAAERIINEASQ